MVSFRGRRSQRKRSSSTRKATKIIKPTHRTVFNKSEVKYHMYLPTAYEITDLNVHLFGNDSTSIKFRACFFYTFQQEDDTYLYFKVERYGNYTFAHMKHYLTRQYYTKGHNTLSAKTFREDPHKQEYKGSLLSPVVKFNHRNDIEAAYRNVDLLVQNGIDLPHNEDVFSWFVYFLRYVSFSNLYESKDGTNYDTCQTNVLNPMCEGPAKGAWVIKLEKKHPNLFDMLNTCQYGKETVKTAKVKTANISHLLQTSYISKRFANIDPASIKKKNIRYITMCVATINTKTIVEAIKKVIHELLNTLQTRRSSTNNRLSYEKDIQKFNTCIRTGNEIFIPDSDTLLRMFATFMQGLATHLKQLRESIKK